MPICDDRILRNDKILNYLPSKMIVLLDLVFSLESLLILNWRHDAKIPLTYEHALLVVNRDDNVLMHDICKNEKKRVKKMVSKFIVA